MEKPKKKWYQKWWIWVIVFLIVVSIITPDKDDSSAKETHVSDTSEEEPVEEESLVFELVAGEPGEYGEMFTMNEEEFYVFRIPAGTYTVTNTGEYMNQVNVYSDEIIANEDGYDEYTDGFSKLLDVGAADTITVPEDYFIEIHEPARFTFELIE